VQRRHRRELVGDGLVGVLGVDARAVALQGVDEAVLVEHSGWCQRIGDVDDERDHRHRDEPVAEPGVEIAVAQHHPADEREAGGEVDEHVVVVEDLDQSVQPHRHPLDAVLAEQVQGTLDVDHPAGVGERRIGVVAREVADLLVADEGGDDDDDLAHGEPTAGGQAGSTWH
jgi:hypothetical protein